MASFASLYEVLGIPMNATRQEIKVAYRNLARTCHPDVVATSKNDKSSHEFVKINIAYSTLSDPNKRVVYDRDIFKQRTNFSSFESIYATDMARGASVGVRAGYLVILIRIGKRISVGRDMQICNNFATSGH